MKILWHFVGKFWGNLSQYARCLWAEYLKWQAPRKTWNYKLIFGTSNFRMQMKQILGQENLVRNFKTSPPEFLYFIHYAVYILLRCDSASMDNWYPSFRDVVAYLLGSCTFRSFTIKVLRRPKTSGTNYPVTQCHYRTKKTLHTTHYTATNA
jgi:hypothetical protein